MKKEEFFKYIRDLCIKSIIYEVMVSPKPGLVDRYNSGSHSDMDVFTFIDSAISLNDYFYHCTRLGYEFNGVDCTEILTSIRPIGIEAEKYMFRATNEVNTHKGLIFSLGIIAASTGFLFKIKNHIYFDENEISKLVMEITKGLSSELKEAHNKEQLTYGEKLYKKYGVKGIRGEVESGFDTVLKYSLPVLERLMDENKYCINDILMNVLLNLMANTEDSNILGRQNMETLTYVKEISQKALELGGYFTSKGKGYIENMDKEFIEKNISPGGSADLLAITIMFYILKNGDSLRGVKNG